MLQLFENDEDKPTRDHSKKRYQTVLQDECEGRGVELKKIASGLSLSNSHRCATLGGTLMARKTTTLHTRSVLETLIV